jgi:hypothetical protein
MNELIISNVLFLICITLQIFALFLKNPKMRMILLLGATITSLILCFVSPIVFLWMIISVLCAINAYINYNKWKKSTI